MKHTTSNSPRDALRSLKGEEAKPGTKKREKDVYSNNHVPHEILRRVSRANGRGGKVAFRRRNELYKDPHKEDVSHTEYEDMKNQKGREFEVLAVMPKCAESKESEEKLEDE